MRGRDGIANDDAATTDKGEMSTGDGDADGEQDEQDEGMSLGEIAQEEYSEVASRGVTTCHKNHKSLLAAMSSMRTS